jgi:hypothetical protein
MLATLTSALGATGCASPRRSEEVQQYIVERSKQWTDCYITGNPAVMELILAPDFINTNPRGRKSGKSAALEAARGGPAVFESAKAGPVEVRVFGDMAIAFGGDLLVLKEGTPREITTAWTDTWLLRQGQWLAIASHESEVSPTSEG